MAVRANRGQQAAKYIMGCLYRHLHDAAVEATGRVDPRVQHADFAPGTDAAGRRLLNSTSPVTRAAHRKLASFERGEPQVIPADSIRTGQFPNAAAIPFLQRTSPYEASTEDHKAGARLVRVYTDERVEVAPTRGVMLAEERLPTE